MLGNFDYTASWIRISERVKEIKAMGESNKAIKIRKDLDIDSFKSYDHAEIILFDTPGMEKSIKFPAGLIGDFQRVKGLHWQFDLSRQY